MFGRSTSKIYGLALLASGQSNTVTTSYAGQYIMQVMDDYRECKFLCILYYIILYYIVLYCIVLYCIVLYCIVLYCIVLYCIVLYCIVLKKVLALLCTLISNTSCKQSCSGLGNYNQHIMPT